MLEIYDIYFSRKHAISNFLQLNIFEQIFDSLIDFVRLLSVVVDT